ncbi:LamG-like jellyroll fold domain-containing protein [Spirillospora sp. NPDC050679]
MGLASYHLEYGGYLFARDSADYAFGTGDFTVEAWVRTLAGGAVFGKQGMDGGGFWLVARPDGTIGFATCDGPGVFGFDSAATAVCDGVWHHVAAVRQGAALFLYLDGVQVEGSTGGGARPPVNVDNPQRVTLGSVDRPDEPYREFTGSLAEVRLWNRARTAGEIATALGIVPLPGTAGLVGYWPLEGGQPLDFTPGRKNAHPEGVVRPSTDAPPVRPGNAPAMLFLFGGAYDTADGSPAPSLRLTGAGYVVQGDQVLTGAVIAGNTVTWAAEGNPTEGSVTFALSGSDGSQPGYCFQGWYRPDGGASVDYRGVLRPRHTGCGMLLNIASGLVVHTPDCRPGAPVTLAPKAPGVHDDYCLYDGSRIVQMLSGLVVSVQGDLVRGAGVVLDELGADPGGQSWTFGGDGLIRPAGAPSLALAVDHELDPARLVLGDARRGDPSQQFVTLSNAQFLWSGRRPRVLAAAGDDYTRARAALKTDDAPAELWFRVRSNLVNAANGAALAVSGRAAPGAALALARLDPASSAQSFVFDQGRLLHASSHLPVVMGRDGAAVLGRSDERGPECEWTMAPYQPADGQAVAAEAPAAKAVDYLIRVYTSDALLSGTDDKVEIALVGDTMSKYVELKKSDTHSDPFESGSMDEFKVTLAGVGVVQGINVRYGADNWFWNDAWVVDDIQVYDPSVAATYHNTPEGGGGQTVMPSQIYIPLPYPAQNGVGSLMRVGKAPTQDQVTRGWVDHTWNLVTGDHMAAYFDNAGGHGGPGAVEDVITAHCSLHAAVRMATGRPIDPRHPRQEVYGHNDVNGVQTCGVRASGFRNWDGQCHQMANRLLYVCEPMVTLDDAPDDKKPAGYGLAVLAFGRYGMGFEAWCRAAGFRAPFEGSASLFDFVHRNARNVNEAIRIAYHAMTLQAEVAADPQGVDGPAAHKFFAAVKREGVSDKTMSEVVNLPEDKIVEEQRAGL